MTQDEQEKVKHSLQLIRHEIVALTSIKTEVEASIEGLRSMESVLVTLLSTEDRIHNLFQ